MILPIRKIGDPILEKPCAEVDVKNLGGYFNYWFHPEYAATWSYSYFIQQMIETARFHNAAGLAANQVGKSLRIFICEDHGQDLYSKEGHAQYTNPPNYEVFINPIILESFSLKETKEEGCLSIPKIWAQVPRYQTITINYFNQKGKKIRRTVNGLAARICAHEQDHIDGILFLERATNIRFVKSNSLPVI